MEDILDFYGEKPIEGSPRLCIDERPCVLHGETVMPLPMQSGKVKKIDCCYERHGTAVLFLAYNLDTGACYAEVRKHRKSVDYAEFIYALQTEIYPDQKLRIVQDNLNTHTTGSFYKRYDAEIARHMSKHVEFHFPPTHASWLNMAEILFSAISKQCLDRRIGTIESLDQEVQAWIKDRNAKGIKVQWQFNIQDARIKLKRHYKEQVNSKN